MPCALDIAGILESNSARPSSPSLENSNTTSPRPSLCPAFVPWMFACKEWYALFSPWHGCPVPPHRSSAADRMHAATSRTAASRIQLERSTAVLAFKVGL
jgi:hypothetical protein